MLMIILLPPPCSYGTRNKRGGQNEIQDMGCFPRKKKNQQTLAAHDHQWQIRTGGLQSADPLLCVGEGDDSGDVKGHQHGLQAFGHHLWELAVRTRDLLQAKASHKNEERE